MESADRDAYLRRLGLDAEPPSVDALARLHRAQVERVPYETVWIHQGQRWSIDPAASVQRIAHDGRGGYCYHLNGALAQLLDALGYRVTHHLGGVHGPDGPDVGALGNHLVLVVHDLASDDNPDGRWYVDTGLGDALHGPLPLRVGGYDQTPFRFRLDETDDGVGDWHLTHDPSGSFAGMSFRAEPTGLDAFATRHEWLSTSPESGFVRVLTVQRRTPTGVDILRGRVLTAADATTTTFDDVLTWLDAIDDLGVRLDLTDDPRNALWEGVSEAHEAHLAHRASPADDR